jgi:hypothetical protein
MRAPIRIFAQAKQTLAKLAHRLSDHQQEIGQAAQIAPDHLRACIRGVNLYAVLLRVGELAVTIAADRRDVVMMFPFTDVMRL